MFTVSQNVFNEIKTIKGFENLTLEQLNKGYAISLTVKDGDSPEDFCSKNELFCLSAFYEYEAAIKSNELREIGIDEYVFEDSDLVES